VNLRIQCLCVDSVDPPTVAAFWQAALGWRRTYEKADEIVLEPPEDGGSGAGGVLGGARRPGGERVLCPQAATGDRL